MKTKIITWQEITFTEGDRFITFTRASGEKVKGVDSNLPYKKDKEDWSFYQRSLKRLCKYL